MNTALGRDQSNIHLAGGLDHLPEPMDLNAISRAMNKAAANEKSDNTSADASANGSMTHGAGRNYVVSDRRFGSFWDYDTQGLLLASTYNIKGRVKSGASDSGLGLVPGTESHPSGPALRIHRFMPGTKPANRVDKDGTTRSASYEAQIVNAARESAFIARQIKRGGFQNPPINIFNSDQWFLFRLTETQHEPDDAKLIDKILQFHQFVIETNAAALARRIDRRTVVGPEHVWRYPATMGDLTMPALRRPDGAVFTADQFVKEHLDPDGEYMDEYVPAIACDTAQQHVVLAVLPTPTLLNCVNESKYLRESEASSPLGRGDYDEAILVRVTRGFPADELALGFKDNFAKHAMPEASFHIARMNERIPLLSLFTEQTRSHVPRTYHKQISQTAMVDLPEAAEIKRQLAESHGVAMAHFGPEQTREEAEAEMEKVRRMSRARERKLKMDEMVAKLNAVRAQTQAGGPLTTIAEASETSKKSDDGGGGGGSKE